MDLAALRRHKAESVKIDQLSKELGTFEDKADTLEDAYLDLCDRVAVLNEDILCRKNQREATSSATGMLIKGERAFDEKLKSAVRKYHLLKDEIGRLKRNKNKVDMINSKIRKIIDNKRHQRIRNEIKLKEYELESRTRSEQFAKALKNANVCFLSRSLSLSVCHPTHSHKQTNTPPHISLYNRISQTISSNFNFEYKVSMTETRWMLTEQMMSLKN